MKHAIIIGAMKSGTTSLFEYLSHHPFIAPCRIKEPNFFSDETRWSRGPEWYRGLFDWDPGTHQWALEASTAYTKPRTGAIAAERMASFSDEKRLIFIMRDPVERLRSHIAYGKAKKWPSFAGSVSDIPDKVFQVSLYAKQLKPYLNVVPRDDLLMLFFEDLMESPGEIVARTLRHLGLDPDLQNADVNRAHNVTSEKLVRPDWYRRIRDHPFVAGLRRLIPAKRWVARYVLRFDRASEVRFDREQREWILERLSPDLEELRTEFGVDISRWGVGF